jgi:DNA-directed RNA polymerase subunit alpha
MAKITCVENFITKSYNHFSSFLIEPLEPGQGITIGNAIRRTLLADITGFAITEAKINDVKHEFVTIESVRDDVLEILLNFKEIVFKESVFLTQLEPKEKCKITGFINVQGPCVVTAGMLQLPKNSLSILNPEQYICTILDSSSFFCEILIEKGKNYRTISEKIVTNKTKDVNSFSSSSLLTDSVFTPVKRASFKVKLIHDSYGNLKESLFFEIVTKANTSPKRCLFESIKYIIDIFYPLIIDSKILFEVIN